MLKEAVEMRREDLQGKLTWWINLTSREAKELVKTVIHDRPEYGFENAMRLQDEQYGNPHKLLASYRKETRLTKIKPGDAAAYRRLLKAWVCFFHQIFIFSSNISPSKTMTNALISSKKLFSF